MHFVLVVLPSCWLCTDCSTANVGVRNGVWLQQKWMGAWILAPCWSYSRSKHGRWAFLRNVTYGLILPDTNACDVIDLWVGERGRTGVVGDHGGMQSRVLPATNTGHVGRNILSVSVTGLPGTCVTRPLASHEATTNERKLTPTVVHCRPCFNARCSLRFATAKAQLRPSFRLDQPPISRTASVPHDDHQTNHSNKPPTAVKQQQQVE